MTASYIRLEEQGFRGIAEPEQAIVPGEVGTFVLALPTDCAFTALTTATKITVHQLSTTNVHDNTTIEPGAILRVHGLLFWDGTSEVWRLIASTISAS